MIARKRLQALVLNDEPSFEEFISRMMSTLNWDCEVVASPEKALARLKAGQFDVLLTDYRLPDLPQGSSLHFISCLRREGITVPAIVMSEDAKELQTVPKDQLTISAVLLKPFTVADLRGVLATVCVL